MSAIQIITLFVAIYLIYNLLRDTINITRFVITFFKGWKYDKDEPIQFTYNRQRVFATVKRINKRGGKIYHIIAKTRFSDYEYQQNGSYRRQGARYSRYYDE